MGSEAVPEGRLFPGGDRAQRGVLRTVHVHLDDDPLVGLDALVVK